MDKGSPPPASIGGMAAGCRSEEIVTEPGVPVPAAGVASGECMEATRAGPASSRSFATAAMAVYATGATRCKLSHRDWGSGRDGRAWLATGPESAGGAEWQLDSDLRRRSNAACDGG